MGEHLHKRFDDTLVRAVFQKYVSQDLSVQQILHILGIQRSRFFVLLKKFRQDPEKFTSPTTDALRGELAKRWRSASLKSCT